MARENYSPQNIASKGVTRKILFPQDLREDILSGLQNFCGRGVPSRSSEIGARRQLATTRYPGRLACQRAFRAAHWARRPRDTTPFSSHILNIASGRPTASTRVTRACDTNRG